MFRHIGTVKISSEKIILRKFVLKDSRQMFDNWASSDMVTKYLPWNSHESLDKTLFVISTWINFYKKPDYYNWCIESIKNHNIIGSISLSKFNDKTFSCEVGYCLGADYWNKGIMTECLETICDFAFNIVGVKYIYSECYEQNIPSCRVLKKSGFIYVSRRYDISKERWIKKFVKKYNG